jgi:peptide-N4-(N-acetyl-beta-glucosaminyl)asparagine amidase
MDVSRRYVRNSKYALDRTRAPEAVLLHIMDEIRSMRRSNMSKQDKFRLEGEDMRENRELRNYIISSIAQEIAKISADDIISGRMNHPRPDPDAQKALESRQNNNTAEWIRTRGEGGNGTPNQQNERDQHPR